MKNSRLKYRFIPNLMIEGVKDLNDKKVNIKTLRKQCRLSTIMLDEKDKERLKAAYIGGFTHAKLNNNICHNVVSHQGGIPV